jgi:metal-responsive CopG/Arc/MetJ family transcriptional regulator
VRTIRLSDDLLERIDAWARRQGSKPARSEAIRRLLERGLSSDVQGRVSPKMAARAAEMAEKKLDQLLTDQLAPPDERARRKQRLVKGPKEFRD